MTLPLLGVETLAMYLRKYEHEGQLTDSILTFCGGFHHERKGFFFAYQLILGLLVFTYFCSVIVFCIFESSMWFVFVAFLTQAFILVPIVIVAAKRLKEPISQKQVDSIPATVSLCKTYLSVALMVTAVYLALSIYSDIHLNVPSGIVVTTIVGVLGLISIALVNVWGIFFMVLDALVAQAEIRSLIAAAKKETLTLTDYDHAHNQLCEFSRDSSSVSDGVAVVAYISIIVCVMSLFLYHQLTSNASLQSYQTGFYVWVIGSFCLQCREALMILLVLPFVAEVNELHEQLVDTLARNEWGQVSRSTIQPDTTVDEYVVNSSDVLANHKNNTCLRLLAAAMTRPLYMYVLGRAVKRTEIKAQLTTVVLLVIGALGSFIVDTVISSTSI